MPRFNGFHQLINDEWNAENNAPTHAWVRYILACGIKPDIFGATYKNLKNIKRVFGRRALICPVNIDPHDIESIDFKYSVDKENGGLKIGIASSKTHVIGGPHFLIVVESDESESNSDNANGLEIIDAAEALLRLCLGANAVYHVNATNHISLSSGEFTVSSESFHIFGDEESARIDESSIMLVGELLTTYDCMSPDLRMRFLLAFRWINKAFREHELIYYLTALEILAGSHKPSRVYKLIASAYQAKQAQKFAKEFYLEHIYSLRNNYIHDGKYVSMTPIGASYLLAIFHDMARKVANLECNEYADKIRKSNDILLEFTHDHTAHQGAP